MIGQLGSHVHGSPDPSFVVLSSIGGKSQAKVDHSYMTVPADHYVFRFQVVIDDTHLKNVECRVNETRFEFREYPRTAERAFGA